MNSKASSSKQRSRRKNRQRRRETPPTARQGLTALADVRFQTPLFPPRFRKHLQYTEVGLVNTSAAGLAHSYFFSANGLFDPNVTGAGHQPMGFDQMMLMYEQYTVLSSKITVKFINSSAAQAYTACGLYLSPDTTQILSASQLIENGLLVWDQLMPIEVVGSMKTMSLNCDIATYLGRNRNKRALVDDPNLFGTAAANPTEQAYFGVLVFDPTAVNVAIVTFTIMMEFEVIFWEPRKLIQS